MSEQGWGASSDDTTWAFIQLPPTLPQSLSPSPPHYRSEALVRFSLVEDELNGFVAIPIEWERGEVYMLVIQRREMRVLHDLHGKQTVYATKQRKLRLKAKYWVRFRLEPDPLMPAHPRVQVYLWPNSGKQPEKATLS